MDWESIRQTLFLIGAITAAIWLGLFGPIIILEILNGG